uniref:Myosin motor domain-containing protein n=1 Tax=Trichobilharzia regenti TaxID=157069 RepID=A0AA85JZG1_TRIRE|nr:unnamed protein product [Trichobilharzia regenti]
MRVEFFGIFVCVIVKIKFIGESGAGKTESTKLLSQFLAAVSGQHSWTEQQILDSNPIMEAFGNAKTVRNDNSSRFGKYIEIHFSRERGNIVSAKIDQYLLEKSRIVTQTKNERNYHAFYYMLAGMSSEMKNLLGLTKAEDYDYLIQGGITEMDGRHDSAGYTSVNSALKVLTFTSEDIDNIWKILAALLHLGNVYFVDSQVNGVDACEVSSKSHSELEWVSRLLQVSPASLATAITVRMLHTGGECVTAPLSRSTAVCVRDALVKTVYNELFTWIVNKINTVVYNPPPRKIFSSNSHVNNILNLNSGDTPVKNAQSQITHSATETDLNNVGNSISCEHRISIVGPGRNTIGILDIFGFENFVNNSFEQFCINYANENFQQFFVRHIFKLEQEEYLSECINWNHIDYVDNQDVLNLIAIQPMNILALLDEESRFPQGTDNSFLHKINSRHSSNPYYVRTASETDKRFGIQHFTGVVYYYVDGFLDKNRDTVSSNLVNLILQSENEFLRSLFTNSYLLTDKSSQSIRTRKRLSTLSIQFKKSLDNLMRTLNNCQPFFVRCIKPNDVKQPNLFDRELCLKQLRYSGMMETIRIRRAGYPIRHKFVEFIDRYHPIIINCMKNNIEGKEMSRIVQEVCASVLVNKDYCLGRSKIYLKYVHDTQLEYERDRILNQSATKLQANWRTFIAHRKYTMAKMAIIHLQAIVRGWIARKSYKKVRCAVIKIQTAYYHYYKCKRKISESVIIQLQALSRGYLVRCKVDCLHNAAMRIQKAYKTYLLKRKIEEMKYLKQNTANEFPNCKQYEPISDINQTDELLNTILQDSTDITQDDLMIIDEKIHCKTPDQLITTINHSDIVLNENITKCIDIPGVYGESKSIKLDKLNYPSNDYAISHVEVSSDDSEKGDSKFIRFATTYFQAGATPYFTNELLTKPLLFHNDEEDNEEKCITNKRTLMNTKCKNLKCTPALQTNSIHLRMLDNTLNPDQNEKTGNEMSSLKCTHSAENMLSYTKENLSFEKSYHRIHFIFLQGIMRSSLQDEIYCQICKLINGNPNMQSQAHGWFLLALCTGCFPPSEKLRNSIFQFINSDSNHFVKLCKDRLQRTLRNGIRNEPPSLTELCIIKNNTDFKLDVTTMDGCIHRVLVDSATKVSEVCHLISNKINLKDSFGFSLFIQLFDELSALGDGEEYIMDTISRYEYNAMQQGTLDLHVKWTLYFRKEIFYPWHDSSIDMISTRLIYQQVIHGVQYGVYQCNDDNLRAKLLACEWIISELTNNMRNEDNLFVLQRENLTNWLEKRQLPQISKWSTLINQVIQKDEFPKSPTNPDTIRQEVVNLAKANWPLLFSKFYEAHEFKGPDLSAEYVVIAINENGLYIIHEEDQILRIFLYPEIYNILNTSLKSSNISVLTLTTVKRVEYTFLSKYSGNIQNITMKFISGLKQRSVYAIAIKHSQEQCESNKLLSMQPGDLIIIDKYNKENEKEDTIMNTDIPLHCERKTDSPFLREKFIQIGDKNGWCYGKNKTNGKEGLFLAKQVYILPCLSYPTNEIITLFNLNNDNSNNHALNSVPSQNMHIKPMMTSTESHFSLPSSFRNFRESHMSRLLDGTTLSRTPLHTLEEYASRHFQKIPSTTPIWKYTNEPISMPLLQEFSQSDSEVCQMAVKSFDAIMQYMDSGLPNVEKSLQLTDFIFQSFLHSPILRDEIYCQLVKQMTYNNNDMSVRRGWQLLWLATGLATPSSELMKELEAFLRSSRNKFGKRCLQRLKRTLSQGQRHYPPYESEVFAIQSNTEEMPQEICFPDGSHLTRCVDSSTKVKDLLKKIIKTLEIETPAAYSIIVSIKDQLHTMPNNLFFFDFIRVLTDSIKEQNVPTEAVHHKSVYKLSFIKNLWIDTVPGEDLKIDEMFHYPQELPKYICGYYNTSVEKSVEYGALIAIANGHKLLDMLSLDCIIPQTVRQQLSDGEWRARINNAMERFIELNKVNARTKFLQSLKEYITFGSSFMKVKQTTMQKFPENIILAINQRGLLIMNATTKESLEHYPLNEIATWSFSDESISLYIGNPDDFSELKCETIVGYKIDELLGKYKNQLFSASKDKQC